jgi:hypothetical protein
LYIETGPAPLPDQQSLFFLDYAPRGLIKVKTGDKVVLDCEASGRPTPTIHWLFNGKRITQVHYRPGLMLRIYIGKPID